MNSNPLAIVDSIIAIGKIIYYEIPGKHTSRCHGCPLLQCLSSPSQAAWRCKLRSYNLCFDGDGPMKADYCPVPALEK